MRNYLAAVRKVMQQTTVPKRRRLGAAAARCVSVNSGGGRRGDRQNYSGSAYTFVSSDGGGGAGGSSGAESELDAAFSTLRPVLEAGIAKSLAGDDDDDAGDSSEDEDASSEEDDDDADGDDAEDSEEDEKEDEADDGGGAAKDVGSSNVAEAYVSDCAAGSVSSDTNKTLETGPLHNANSKGSGMERRIHDLSALTNEASDNTATLPPISSIFFFCYLEDNSRSPPHQCPPYQCPLEVVTRHATVYLC